MLELILKVTVTDVLLFSDFPSSFWNLITYNLMQNQKKFSVESSLKFSKWENAQHQMK